MHPHFTSEEAEDEEGYPRQQTPEKVEGNFYTVDITLERKPQPHSSAYQ